MLKFHVRNINLKHALIVGLMNYMVISLVESIKTKGYTQRSLHQKGS